MEFERWRVKCPGCGGVHVEQLVWLTKNPRYTQRFAMHVGTLCRDMTNKAVAEMERLHHSTVKDLDKLYMQSQVERAGLPAPRAIGIDEISIGKGHNYRVIISDLDRGHPVSLRETRDTAWSERHEKNIAPAEFTLYAI